MTNPEAPAPGRPSRAELLALIEKQKQSGKSIAAFARAHGVEPWRLYQATRSRKPRRTPAPAPAPSPEFVEVKAAASATDLELVIRETTRIRIPTGFDEVTLRRLLGVFASC